MPKKPFTAEEITAQRERIMDSASQVLAAAGFHHLSMRKLAAQLGMTASNIYNYFPDKETLFLQTRSRGFELALTGLREQMTGQGGPEAALHCFAGHLTGFAQRYPGYYQLMFQPPQLQEADAPLMVDQDLQLQVGRQAEEWQRHLLRLLADAVPGLAGQHPARQAQLALFFVSALHGLIDAYQHRTLSLLLDGVELIPDSLVQAQVHWLLAALQPQVTAATA